MESHKYLWWTHSKGDGKYRRLRSLYRLWLFWSFGGLDLRKKIKRRNRSFWTKWEHPWWELKASKHWHSKHKKRKEKRKETKSRGEERKGKEKKRKNEKKYFSRMFWISPRWSDKNIFLWFGNCQIFCPFSSCLTIF